MTIKRALITIESTGQSAHYETDPMAADGQPWNVPALVIEVTDFEEALELVETLNRSRAQKRRVAKAPEPPQPEALPAPEKKPAADKHDAAHA